jgi:hypothetical protein
MLALLVFVNKGSAPDRTATGAPANFSRVPYFLRYNVPTRKLPDTTDVVPQVAVFPTGGPLAVGSANGFAGPATRIV